MYIYKYETDSEKNSIINEQESLGRVLTDISNVAEGNFLGFKEEEEANLSVEAILENIKQTHIDEYTLSLIEMGVL